MLLRTKLDWEETLATASTARDHAVKSSKVAVQASRSAAALSRADTEELAAAKARADVLYEVSIGADADAVNTEARTAKVRFNLRPAVSVLYDGVVCTGDIVFAFILPTSSPWSLDDVNTAGSFSDPHVLIQWHKELLCAPTAFPCTVVVLDELYTIISWEAIINRVLVSPQLGPIAPSRFRAAPDRVVAFCNKDVLHCG